MTGAIMSSLTTLAAKRFGERTAIHMEDGERVSFARIDQRAARFAGGLDSVGVAQGDRVILYLPNSIDWVIAYHAIARLGAVIVPANILLSSEEVGYIAADSGASVIICGGDRHDAIAASLTDAVNPVIIVKDGNGTGVDFAQVAQGPSMEPRPISPDGLFTVAYTSGTTGKPKGAMTSHRAVYDSVAMTATIHARHSGDRILTALPFPHVYGNVVLNAAFRAGYTLFVMQRFDPPRALAMIDEHRITLFEGVPTMYYQMLQCPELGNVDLASLTRCTVGGQTMPTASILEVEHRFGCPLLELWGMTELAGPATSHSPYWPAHHGSIGLPFPGTEVRIADMEDASQLASAGAAGELQVRGSLVTMGYWNNPEATKAAFDQEGWFATGDIATQDEDGYLTIVDRRKDMIITAGYNIYPAELEQVIAGHPSVAMVAVAPVADAEKGELAKAYIVLRPGQVSTEAEIAAHCREHLASYKVPRLIAFVDDLPKTSTGKIMRRALAQSEPNAALMERI